MKKQTWRSAAGILLSALLVTSCSLEEFDLEDKVPEGKEENLTIADKNSGTLNINEKYAQAACLYNVEDNPEGILSVEFLPTGTYVITRKESNYPTTSIESPAAQTKTVTVNTPKGPMRVPILTGKKAETRSENGGYYYTQTGTYVYTEGTYRPTNESWSIENGKLIMSSNGRVYTVSPAKPIATGALTERLCHTWKIERELIKVYDMNNLLIGTYKLSDTDIEESYVAFSRYGTFLDYGYDHEDGEFYADAGTWTWIDQHEQRLRHMFYSDGEAFETTVYFANNHLYMTQEADDIYDSDYFYDDYGCKALVLVCFSAVGN